MTNLVMQLNCNFTDDDKESCLPTIRSIIELANLARVKGILALELEVKHTSNLFLKTGLLLVLDGTDPAIVKLILQNLILADKYSGSQLLDRLLMYEGVLAMQQGETPYIIAMKLYSMLGEKYISTAKEAFSIDGERMKKYYDFLQTSKSRVALPESASFESIILNLDNRSIQIIIGDIGIRDLTLALKGCGFKTIHKILENVSTNTCLQICENLELFNPLRNESIFAAQEKIINVYMKYSQPQSANNLQ